MSYFEDLLKNWQEIVGMNKPLAPNQPRMATPPFMAQRPERPPVPPQVAEPPAFPPLAAASNEAPAFDFASSAFPELPELKPVERQSQYKVEGLQPIVAGSEYNEPLEDITTMNRDRKSGMIDKPWYKDSDKTSVMFSALSDALMGLSGNDAMGAINKANYAKGMQGIQGNKTMDYLIKNKPELAKKLMGLPPEYLDQYMGEAIKAELGTDRNFRTQVSTMRTDEKTGRMYYLESDGNGNQKIIYAKDDNGEPLYGDTGKARQDREIHTAGVEQARAAGTKFFDKSESLKSSLDTFKQARLALDSGARSGIIDSALPALDANTQNLRSLANTAGIEVINSATFGALSEKELALAMSTGIPTSLGEDQLDAYLDAKIKAQEKLYNEISKKAQQLNTGNRTLGGWQEYWANEERPETYNDEYARRFVTDDMNTGYKGWRSEEDDEKKDKSKTGRRWSYD